MEKINHINVLGTFYKQPKKKISLVDVPPLNFLMIDGSGSPNNNQEYTDSVGALYAIAYKLKFSVKNSAIAVDFKVMPLEGLWWAEDMSKFTLKNRENWLWRMMIMQPDFISRDMFEKTVAVVKSKKDNPMLENVRFETYSEGLSMQIFHIGPYGEGERESIEKLHNQIEIDGYALFGKHHEIYFNSPLKTAPENLKTIIRQPMKAK